MERRELRQQITGGGRQSVPIRMVILLTCLVPAGSLLPHVNPWWLGDGAGALHREVDEALHEIGARKAFDGKWVAIAVYNARLAGSQSGG
jgi:hypothetical protein